MNAQYQTGIQNRPPQTEPWLAQMRNMQSPFSYGQAHADAVGGLMQKRVVDMGHYAQQMQDTYAAQQQQAEMQAALAGLEHLTQERQNQDNLQTSRLQTLLGFQGNLLRGLLQ